MRLAQAFVKKGSVGKGGSVRFDWRGLGYQVGVCFNSIPSNVSFLYGPLDAGYIPKKRKISQKRKWKDVEGEEEEVESIVQRHKNVKDHQLSAVERDVQRMRKDLKRKSKEQHESITSQHGESYINSITQDDEEVDDNIIQKRKIKLATEASRVDACKFLFAGTFTETVENIYKHSFAVSKNKAGIGFRTLKDAKELRKAGIDNLGPGPVVYPVTSKDVAARQRINTQAVLAFNMKVSRFF